MPADMMDAPLLPLTARAPSPPTPPSSPLTSLPPSSDSDSPPAAPPLPRAHRPYTPAEDALLATLRTEGKSGAEIGQRLGRGPQSAYNRLAYLQRQREEEGESDGDGEGEGEGADDEEEESSSLPTRTVRRFTPLEDSKLLACLRSAGGSKRGLLALGPKMDRNPSTPSPPPSPPRPASPPDFSMTAAASSKPPKRPWSKSDDARLRSLKLSPPPGVGGWAGTAEALGRPERGVKKRWASKRGEWAEQGLIPLTHSTQRPSTPAPPLLLDGRAPSAFSTPPESPRTALARLQAPDAEMKDLEREEWASEDEEVPLEGV
ncbi:hypothetical protein JCM10207_003465 [Rhodosporidiobolus poonsookiae]